METKEFQPCDIDARTWDTDAKSAKSFFAAGLSL
jgi:hypothetical protein